MRETKQYVCEVCGHIHDEAEHGWFEDLPKYANCPECGVDVEEAYKLFE
jgi:rubredoxin